MSIYPCKVSTNNYFGIFELYFTFFRSCHSNVFFSCCYLVFDLCALSHAPLEEPHQGHSVGQGQTHKAAG